MEKYAEGIKMLASLMVISLTINLLGRMGTSIKGMRKSATKSWQRNLTDLIGYVLMFAGLAAAIVVFNIRA